MLSLDIIESYDQARRVSDKPFRSACYAPFTSMLLDTTGVVRVCCVNHAFLLGDLRRERLRDIWNGTRMRQLRQALTNYDFSLGCGLCEWKISQGEFAEKTLQNSTLMAYKFEQFTLDPENIVPRHLEFHISNTCNLACATCWGEYSTIIRSKREQLPPVPRAYGDEFFSDLEEFLPHLEQAHFLGGEPFLIREHGRIWDMMIERGLSTRCHIVTNGTQFNQRVEHVLNSLTVSLTVSIDGASKETFESIRVNAKHDVVMANLIRLRDICRERGQGISVMFTLSTLNWFEFPDLLLIMEDLGIPVAVSQLWEPKRFSLFALAAEPLQKIVATLEERNLELESRLKINALVWSNHLREIRDHAIGLENRTQEHRATSQAPSQAANTIAPEALAAEAFSQTLNNEANDFPPIRVEHDGNYIIQGIRATGQLAETFGEDLVGKTLDDLIVVMKRRFGTRVHLLEEEHRGASVLRLIQFVNDDTGTATLLRHGTFQPLPGEPGIIVFAGRAKLDSRLDFSA